MVSQEATPRNSESQVSIQGTDVKENVRYPRQLNLFSWPSQKFHSYLFWFTDLFQTCFVGPGYLKAESLSQPMMKMLPSPALMGDWSESEEVGGEGEGEYCYHASFHRALKVGC